MKRYHLGRNYAFGEVCRDNKILESREVVAELNRLTDRLEAAEREKARLNKRLDDEDVSHSNTVDQRDHAEEMADKLSAAIMGITGRDIGEHSSANCPWSNAVEHAEEYECERDALEAHVERLRKQLQSAIYRLDDMLEGDDGQAWDEARRARPAMQRALEDAPETSLARHPDDVAVDRFAGAMKAKLARAREKGRGGWEDIHACRVRDLVDMMIGHLSKGNEGTWEDVANFCMMLHQRGDAPAELADGMARLKAEWCEKKAQHFMELADNARENGFMAQADAVEDMAQELKDEAAELRRQAEEGS